MNTSSKITANGGTAALKIGEFSKLSKVSVKMLRHYPVINKATGRRKNSSPTCCFVDTLLSSCNFSVFNRQYACAFLEQLGKAAGGGVADHLGDLSHSEIGVDEQMLRLAHTASLDIFRYGASGVPLEAGF